MSSFAWHLPRKKTARAILSETDEGAGFIVQEIRKIGRSLGCRRMRSIGVPTIVPWPRKLLRRLAEHLREPQSIGRVSVDMKVSGVVERRRAAEQGGL